MKETETVVRLNGGKTKIVITQVNDSTIRLSAIGIMSILHVIPEANNAVQLKVVKYNERAE